MCLHLHLSYVQKIILSIKSFLSIYMSITLVYKKMEEIKNIFLMLELLLKRHSEADVL